jgi:uncharacterized membrane protein HdeD (DUF308 family)
MAKADNGAFMANAGLPHIKWGWLLAYGIFLVIGALIVIANPVAAGGAVGILLGIVLLVLGVGAVITGFTALHGGARWVEVILGVLAVIAGWMVIRNPFSAAATLVWAIGLWMLVSGIFELIFAFRAERDKGWRFLLAAVDIVLGLILVFSGPGVGLAYLGFMIAFRFLFRGAFMITAALGLRKVGKALHR